MKEDTAEPTLTEGKGCTRSQEGNAIKGNGNQKQWWTFTHISVNLCNYSHFIKERKRMIKKSSVDKSAFCGKEEGHASSVWSTIKDQNPKWIVT